MKGLFFSLIMLSVALILVELVAIQKGLISFAGEQLAVEIRINSMNNFYDSIIIDCEKALDIISRRAVSAAISNVITNGIGLQNADSSLEELIVNGSINGTEEALMKDATIIDWKNKMEEIGNLNGFNTNITFQRIKVEPYDSWNLITTATLYIDLSDQRGVANITRVVNVSKLVPIEGFEDPIYPLNSNGRGTNIIIKSPYWGNFTQKLINSTGGNNWFAGYSIVIPSSQESQMQNVPNKNQKVLVTDNTSGIESTVNQFGGVVSEADITSDITIPFVDNAANAMSIVPNNSYVLVDGSNGAVWNIDNLKNDIEHSYYHPSLKGGSILDRLEGKLEVQNKYQSRTSNIIGLESFVDKNYLSSLDVLVDADKTNVDHIYFNAEFNPTSYSIKGIGNNFKIDKDICTGNLTHAEIYNSTEILV
jgi:phosphohistidine swiveling domain-containing protein